MAQQKEALGKSKNIIFEKLQSLQIILVEDEPTHAVVMRHTIRSANPNITLKVAASLKEYRKAIDNSTPDLVLMDMYLPDGKALDTLKSPLEDGLFPVIVMTSSGDEKTAVKAMKAGALDYIVKSTDAFKSMPHTIERALNEWRLIKEHKQAEEELRESELRYRSLYENVSVGLYRTTPSGKILMANRSLVQMLGYENFEQLSERNLTKAGFGRTTLRKEFLKKIETEDEINDYESTWTRQDGSLIIVKENARAIRDAQGRTMYYDGTVEDITEQRLAELAGKYAEDALWESEKKYHSLFDNAVEGIYYTTPEGRFTNVNRAFAKMLGFESPEEVIKSITDITKQLYVNPDERKKALAILKEDGFIKDYEIQMRRKDGEAIWTSVNARTKKTAGGSIEFEGSVTDITAHKIAEQLIEKEREELKLLIDTVPLIIFYKDRDGRFIRVKKAFAESLKIKEEEFIGRTVFDLYSDEIAQAMTKDDKEVIETKQPKLGILEKYESADGLKWVQTDKIPILDKKNNIVGLIGIAQDMTDKLKSEKALRESEEKFRKAFMTTPDAININRMQDGMYVSVNKGFTKIIGYSEEELIGKTSLELNIWVDPEDRKNVVSKLKKEGMVENYEAKFRTKKDEIKTGLMSATSIELNGVQHLLTITRDITERKYYEEHLRQMQKLEGLGTLAGGIAHDFNNILGIILAYNSSIKRFKDDTKKLEFAAETIAKAVDRGKTIVQQILTFARKSETTFGAVNVNEIVMEVMTMVFETFPKTLTYAQNYEKGMPFINADHTQLYQAILNLCVNARDAMPDGGLLTINTCIVTGVSLCTKHPDVVNSDYVCIEVSDTGEGMDEEIRNRIFEPFFTTKSISKGSGLGLAVVFGVVQTHKGFIDVESQKGKGTTFRIYLPAVHAQVSAVIKEVENLEDIPGGTETILLVEDEEMLMMSLQMMLFEKGYNILTANDGLEALKVYQENKNDISLVLTDLGLPTITGLEVCQRIKKIKPNERMVLATGYLDPDMKTEFLDAGIQHFLLKPYDPQKVIKVIRQILDEKTD
ncbi:MAG: PAS domain S-box protein [Bacteroidetes bacterium]|nr:PAS domain S-box protein [Bacteroidota bacterium]